MESVKSKYCFCADLSVPRADRKKKSCAQTSLERHHAMTIPTLTHQLNRSLRRPTKRTLSLIDKALSYLAPFESSKAGTASEAERQELLTLISTHRLTLCPYLDVDRIEGNLRGACSI